MKIVLIYRKQRKGAHSIEGLFDAIAGALRQHVTVLKYEVGSRWAIPMDVWRLRNMHADIYHITGDVHYFALLLPRARTVLTVHDIYHYSRQLKGLKRWLYKWIWLLLPIRAAGTITAVSEETKRTIQSDLGITDKEITVVPDCVNPAFQKAPKTFNVQRPVVLQVGTRPNKNLGRVIEALSGIPCLLSIIGPLTDEVRTKLRELNIAHDNFTDLSTDEIAQKYVASDLVCFASLYEGFGLPIIEANATGRPVVTSNLQPMMEVGDQAACIVDPYDIQSIKEGLLRIVGDQVYREQLIKNGYDNVKNYSATSVASQFVTLYKSRQRTQS